MKGCEPVMSDDKTQCFESPEHPSFSNFETIALLGQGGMGTVWKARQRNLPRVVALKVLNAGKLARASELRRFKTEAAAAAKLQHSSLVPIFEVGEEQGCCYFTMEYVEGQTLAELLDGTPLEPRQAAELVRSMAEAIDYAHGRGVLHRDLKPSNVIVDPSGRPRIMDFGLAKELYVDSGITESNAILGTPSYMSPEQAEGKTTAITARSDVYSLGAVLYEMITGRPPFRAHNVAETLRQVIAGAPALPRAVNPKVPRDLETISLKCLQKEPGRRYESAGELMADLDRFLRNEPIRARPLGMCGRAWSVLRRNPMVASLVGGTAVLLVLMAFAAVLARADLLAANAQLAHVTAEMLREQLEGLAKEVQTAVESPGLAEAIQGHRVQELEAFVEQALHRANASPKLEWIAATPFHTWSIYDVEGRCLARSLRDGPPRVPDFDDRDYFKPVRSGTNFAAGRVHLSKMFVSRYSDRTSRFGLSAAIHARDGSDSKMVGLLLATVSTRSSEPLNDPVRKIALIGPSDPSDWKDPESTTQKFVIVLHPAYSLRSPAVGVDRLPFDPKKTTHHVYRDPVASRFPAYQGLWLAGSAPIAFPGSEDQFYVVVQSRDWISTFVAIVFGCALLTFIGVFARRKLSAWQIRNRGNEALPRLAGRRSTP